MISTRNTPCSCCVSIVLAYFSVLAIPVRTQESWKHDAPGFLFFGWESWNHEAPPVVGRVNKRVWTGTVLAEKWTCVRFLHLVLAEDWRVQKQPKAETYHLGHNKQTCYETNRRILARNRTLVLNTASIRWNIGVRGHQTENSLQYQETW